MNFRLLRLREDLSFVYICGKKSLSVYVPKTFCRVWTLERGAIAFDSAFCKWLGFYKNNEFNRVLGMGRKSSPLIMFLHGLNILYHRQV